jgi:hypothetical protein
LSFQIDIAGLVGVKEGTLRLALNGVRRQFSSVERTGAADRMGNIEPRFAEFYVTPAPGGVYASAGVAPVNPFAECP